MLSPTKLKETATINVQAALLRLNQYKRLISRMDDQKVTSQSTRN